MKTLLLLSSVLVSSILITAYFSSQEEAQQYSERTFGDLDRRVKKLEREQRMGPKPYCLEHHPDLPWNKKEHDSVMTYLSHMTYEELWEVKGGITDNTGLLGFVDTVLQFKDSLRKLGQID